MNDLEKVLGQDLIISYYRVTLDEYNVTATIDAKIVAKASVKMVRKSLARVTGIKVDPSFRRKGIATAIYQHIEKFSGRRIVKGLNQTKDGEAFWSGRRGRFG